ncbi:hypothetical protein B0T25DRAFT_175145 [Lasiosphaeria hispida]|uniref:Uncharacterized protein n=1 Tax=Lasiosphaeria hispida TaxID=260671 RepID=A0AAJ0HN70_9PEZI|nr:hypothetical protein B0T25DRAFT_175145 [Lasiosphaeria hispida]
MRMDSDALVRTLRAYDASVDATAVKAALDDGPSALRDWVALHVTPDTLLSPDELNQFAALEKAGLAERLAKSTDLAAVQFLSEQEIKDAILELNRSTEAISKQAETLKLQHEALDRLVSGTKKDVDARASLESTQVQSWETTRRSLVQTVEELSQRLDSRIIELEQQGKGDGTSIRQTVDTLFHSDDKLLSSLQKLGWELETEDPEEQDNVVMLRETCARLIKFTVEGLRTKLDRIYLEALESSMRSGATRRVSPNEVSALQEELESLYAEILPVAQMAAEQQFLEPALKNLALKHGQGLAKSDEAIVYIHDCLDYLLDHTEEISKRVEAFQAYQVATTALVDVAKTELSAKVETPPSKGRAAAMPASPSRPKSTSYAMSPVRPSQKSRPRRSSGLGGLADDPPLDEILRSLAISLPQDESVASEARAQMHVRALASILADRQAKANDVARNVQESFEAAATKQIADAKVAVQLVRDSVLAESPFGEVRLVDPEIEGLISVLTQEFDSVKERLESVDVGLAKVKGKSVKRDELIRRWGA